jgi:hypothetical protein
MTRIFPGKMNCDECRELIGAFIDNDLDEGRASTLRAHLAFCPPCAVVCEEVTSLIDVCRTEPAGEILPPDSRQMWLRINNVIENEVRPVPAEIVPRGRSWGISMLRLATALAAIAVVSSIATILALRNFGPPASDDLASRSVASQTTFEKYLGKLGLVETPQQAFERKIKEREAAIEYWNARVQARRSQWDRTTREAFDRNLQVIDESVNDYTTILAKDPDDELSGEMLDAVMNDKMNLLRDFSDL